jgi:UPF0755 protein
VADSLRAHHLIKRPWWFKALARLRGVDREIHAGVYEFTPGQGAWSMLTTLAEGRILMARFTAPEGLSALELADLAQEKLEIPRDSLMGAVLDSSAAAAAGLPRAGWEGYLFPQTYTVPVGIGARDLVHVMATEFLRRWDPGWTARLDTLRLSRGELVTFASIVEGEARWDEDRPIIAGVYWNRLRRGMRLQADPTVQYAIQLATGTRKKRLFFKDYAFPSPYNTYLHRGLPPGPVNSPGAKSLEAALYPAAVPYLYFVAGPDGHHVFSRTAQEHLAATAKMQRLARRQSLHH